MVDMSMGLRIFMTETEEKLKSKADAKALLQKAGWTEVRDLMGELNAHLSEKVHHSSSTLKGLYEKISNIDGKQSASGSVKCISCSRLVAPSPSKSATHWSKNPLDPQLSGGAEEHVHRMKIASAHLYSTDKMPAIESAQKGSVFCFSLVRHLGEALLLFCTRCHEPFSLTCAPSCLYIHDFVTQIADARPTLTSIR